MNITQCAVHSVQKGSALVHKIRSGLGKRQIKHTDDAYFPAGLLVIIKVSEIHAQDPTESTRRSQVFLGQLVYA